LYNILEFGVPIKLRLVIFCLPVCYPKINIKIHRTIILPAMLHGCKTWSLTLRDEHRLRVLRRIFGPKRAQTTGQWRKPHNNELYNLCSSPKII
jgi:hypothetical protein